MRGWWVRSVVFGSVVLLMGAAPVELPEYRKAQAAAKTIVEETRNLLLQAIRDKGPEGAITTCAAVASDLAGKHEPQGWRIRRVSKKVRNPTDSPDPYELRVLEQFEALKAAGQLSRDTEHAEVVTEGGSAYLRYLKPITVASPVCLACHGPGDDLAPGVKTQLHTLYPADQATGYRLDDLRGAVSIRIPIEGKP